MLIYAIIPARSGSKSIKKKNILPFKGKPLFLWSVKVAELSKKISKIFVSTDDEEILKIAISNNVIGIKRPSKLSGDQSRDTEYISHFLDYIHKSEFKMPDFIIILRPTTPERDYLIIDKAIETFESLSKFDSLRSIILSDQTPFKMWFLQDNNSLKTVIQTSDIYQPFNAPRQLLPNVYWQDGYLEIIRVDSYLKGIYPGDIMGFINPSPSYDIDYLKDIPNENLPNKNEILNHSPIDENKYSS